VQQVDQRLSARAQWRELSRFYESLQQLDLTLSDYQLRQAELYINHGDASLGYELLRQLTSDPGVAAQATALLENTDISSGAAQRAEPHQRRDTDSVALGSLGSHYHLPLRLNDTLTV